MDRIKQGDNPSFRSLIESYERLVFHVVCRMVPNTADQEDLCQDVFLKVYTHIHDFRFECRLSTWIASIAYNRCINFLQKKKASLYLDHSRREHLEFASGIENRPDHEVEREDIAARLHEAIAQMDVPYRTILTLYHLEEMEYAEIAQIMGMPEGTVKSYLFRARQKLKAAVFSKYKKEEIWAANT